MVNNVIVLGGGSAGFMAALALKVKVPGLGVTVVRSKDVGVIGVGEGSTIALTKFLHDYLRVGSKKFFETAAPTWKLGLKFLWGPRDHFYYSFAAEQLSVKLPQLSRTLGHYSDDDVVYELQCALMGRDKAFARAPGGAAGGGGLDFGPGRNFSYHFENEKYVRFLEGYATALGVEVRDDTVAGVRVDEAGVAGLALASGGEAAADLYVDASGFRSELLGKALGEPFESFGMSLFCDRAVVGGWDRADPDDQVIRPYTTCETMDAGWCWRIEHESRINRGYVYSSGFVADDDAEREFREKNPKVGPTRVVRFTSGCYRRNWVKNVVAVGNASGFVEPLEATALGVIAMQSRLLADALHDTARRPTPTQAREYNRYHAASWAAVRAFIAAHYKFNTRRDTPFWRHCQSDTDLAGAAGIVEYYRENGPSALWAPTLVEEYNPFGLAGYYALLHGMRVAHDRPYTPTPAEAKFLADRRRELARRADQGVGVREALAMVRSPRFVWAG